MPKQVFIESRNQTLEFPDDATQEEINQVIAAEFPRTGEDVAYDMSKMGSAADIRDFIAAIPDEDYVKLNNYRADKKLSWGELAGISGEAIGTIVGDVVKGVKSAVTEAGEGVLESAARGVGAGTVDLVNLGQKLITPNERIPSIDEFLQTPKTQFGYAYGPGGPSVSQVAATPEDYKTLIDQQRAMELQSLDLAEASENLIKGAPVEEVARGASYLDAITLGGLAKNIAKSGVKTIFKKTAQAPISTAVGTAPSVLPTAAAATIESGESVIPATMRQNAEAFAAKVGEGAKKAGLTGVQLGAGTVKGAADLGKAVIDTAGKVGLSDAGVRGAIGAAVGYNEGGTQGAITGAVVGSVVPKVARAGLAGVSRTADFIGAAAKVAKTGPSRTGIFEKMAQATNISPEARKLAEKVLFTQPFVQYASESVRQAAQRALIGAPIGAALGYAADGEQGAAAGFGAGVGISALGGPLDASIDAAKTIAGRSTARSQRNAMGDIKSFVNDITDDKARSDYAEVMDQAIRVAGPERAADMLDNLRLAEAMGASVQVVPPSQRKNVFNSFSYDGTNGGTITINPDRMTQGTVSHEVFHQLFNVGVKAELQKALRETYLPTRDADGNIVKPGLYDDAEFAKKAAQLAERYKNNPEGYRVALEAQSVLENPAGYSEAALDNARSFVIDEMTAEYAEAFMGRSRPGVFNPDRLPLWHRRLLQQIDDRILNTINDKLYANRNIKDPTVAFTDEQGKPIRVPQLDKVLKRAFANKMSREKGQVAGKTQKAQEVVIPNKPRDLLVFANATFGATRDVLGTDENGNPRILTPQEQKAVTAADFDEAKAMYQTLPDAEKQTVRVTNKVGEPVDVNQTGARIQITSQTPESVFEKFLAVAKSRGMGNQQLANMRQLFASMVANEGPTFNTVNNPVYEFDKRTGTMKAKVRPPTRQEIYPTAITVNSAGGFNVEYIDISRVKANAQKILQNPQYKGVWTDLNSFMADFGRSMRNLSTPNPIPTAELLGNGNAKIGATKRDLIAEAMNVTLPKRLAGKGYVNEPTIDPLTLANKERRVGGSAFRDFRIERLTEVSPTTERLKMVKENAYENIVRRFQPDAFTRETLPNGEALTNPDGYRILKKTGSKLFRVYDDKGELLGTASTEQAAMRKAQSDFAKKATKEEKQTRFQPVTPEQDAAYLNAAKAGDTAAAQRLVDEAAKKAGFLNRVGELFVTEKIPIPSSIKGYDYGQKIRNLLIKNGHAKEGFSENYEVNWNAALRDESMPDGWDRWLGVDDEGQMFIEGVLGNKKPELVIARRRGLVPEIGRSRNLRENTMEKGVSVIEVLKPENQGKGGQYDITLFDKPDNYVIGWMLDPYNTTGGDSEPLLRGAVVIGKVGKIDNQIKSADPVTYDDNGNVIPLSQRFNPESPDIRFQPDSASSNIQIGTNGTRIIKSPSGKFRVYSMTGTLLGIRDSEQAAQKLATK